MELKLSYEQWMALKEILDVADCIERKTIASSFILEDSGLEAKISEKQVTITLPDE